MFQLYSFRAKTHSYSISENTFKSVFRLEFIIIYELVWLVWLGEYFNFTDSIHRSMDFRKVPRIICLFLLKMHYILHMIFISHSEVYVHNLFHNLIHISNSFWSVQIRIYFSNLQIDAMQKWLYIHRRDSECSGLLWYNHLNLHSQSSPTCHLEDLWKSLLGEALEAPKFYHCLERESRFCQSSNEGVPDFDNLYMDRFG